MQATLRLRLPRRWLVAALVAVLAVLAFLLTHLAASVTEHGNEMAEAGAQDRPSGALVVAVVAATLLVGTAVLRRGRLGAAMLVSAPISVYLVGEIAERVLQSTVHPEAAAMVALATQLPAVLLAFLLGRLLIWTARRAARLLARHAAPTIVRAPARTVLLGRDERPRLRIPTDRHLGRGPPLSAST
jgi:hypothetical protein